MGADDASLESLGRACASAWSAETLVDAVVAGLSVLEDDPRFNAGFGSVMTADGDVEVDAGVVEGSTGRYGAVAAVRGLRHPAAVAACVMRSRDAVILSGEGAQRFAASMGHPTSELKTYDQRMAWRAARAGGESVSRFTGRATVAPSTETVGCMVARGADGAAGSSTGGVLGKHAGRIGDSAILGAGIWADKSSAVLCSGQGEAMISLSLARRVADRISGGEPVERAVRWAVTYAEQESGARSAVVAMRVADRQVAAAHNGASFPIMVTDGVRDWLLQPERL